MAGNAIRGGFMARQRGVTAGISLGIVLTLSAVCKADDATLPAEVLGRIIPVTVDTTRPDRPIVGVDLSGARIQDDELKKLGDLPDLETLDLSWNHLLTTVGLRELKRFKKLQTVNLNYVKVTDQALIDLKELHSLRVLKLRATQVTDSGIAELKELKDIVVLDLTDTRTSDASIKELRELKKLESLGLGGSVTNEVLKQLKDLKCL